MKKCFLLIFIFTSFTLFAKQTKLIVRAKAKDAKFIGSSLGGAYFIIRDKVTNKILAEGKTSGSTGNTDLIMTVPGKRGVSITDEQTAKFLAVIDIEEPTFISIEAISPLNNKQAQVKASTELWLIPGKDILGDGVILEIPGFIIDILEPRTHHYISLKSVKDKVFKIKSNIVMMCGCVINETGAWKASEIEVTGILKKDGVYVRDIKLSLTETNLFEANTLIEATGNYELIVYAYNSKSGNTGIDKVNFVIND
jgi:hypothetical protein